MGSPTSGVGARVYFLADYYDASDRLTDEVNVGTNGGTNYTRPSTVPARSDTVLVTHSDYDLAGNVLDTIDPRNIMTQFGYDLLGRKTQEIDASTGGSPATGMNVTNYGYDGNDDVLTMQAFQPNGTTSPSQTTAYLYGVGGTVGANLFSNDALSKVEYPDPTTGNAGTSPSDDVLTTYDLLGEALTQKDQNQTTHSYSYDVLGRLALDSVTTLGSGVDGSIRALGYTYSPLGQPFQQTSYSDAAGTVLVNQVQDGYNGYGQLISQYQAVSGAVNTTTTPQVVYGYSQPSGANYSRLSSMTYPNGRVLDYVYNSGLDSDISRISALADDSGSGAGALHTYTYLGLNTIVQELDGNGVELTYIAQPGDTLASSDGGDRYTGLDRCHGRIIDRWWYDPSTSTTLDRFQYGYDRDGNVLYKNNRLEIFMSELYHAQSTSSGDDNMAYDGLNRITGFIRGTLSASGNNGTTLDTVATPNTNIAGSTQTWNLDSIGNANSITTDGTVQDRAFNSQNEATTVGSNTLGYDSNGNTTTDDQGHTLVYDAWNRLVAVKNGSTTLAGYTFDANGNRISQTEGGTTTDLYYSSAAQVIEERQSGTVTDQYVWGLRYVNDLILRDDNSTSGSLGISGSGLGRRLYVQQDANWNITAIFGAVGAVGERFVYTPYGVRTVLSSSWTATTDAYGVAYGFQGMRYAATTGMLHAGARDYSPTLERWAQQDPNGSLSAAQSPGSIQGSGSNSPPSAASFAVAASGNTSYLRYADGMNDFQFLGNNPLAYSDPTGLQRWWQGWGTTVYAGLGGYGTGGAGKVWLGAGQGVLQGGANAINGAQDAVIGMANIPGTLVNGGSHLVGGGDVIPMIPSPDWSYGLVYNEGCTGHNVSKFLGGQGLMTLLTIGASQIGSASELFHVTTPARAAAIEADAAAGAANAGITGDAIYAASRVRGNIADAVLTFTGRYGGYVKIPGSMMAGFRPIPAVGPISAWARFLGSGYVFGKIPAGAQLMDAFLGQALLGTGQLLSQQRNCGCK